MKQSAFTLIELVIVLTILAILAAIAIPVFQNLHTQARNASTKGALAGIREAISQYRANEIASGRSTGAGSGGFAGWPSWGQVTDRHCTGFDSNKPHVMANADTPPNPWGVPATHVTNGQEDCAEIHITKGQVLTSFNTGWLFDLNTGRIWANSAENDETPSVNGENNCAANPTTENCF